MNATLKPPKAALKPVHGAALLIFGCQCPCHRETPKIPTCGKPQKSGGHLATDPKFGTGYDAIFGPKGQTRSKLPEPSAN